MRVLLVHQNFPGQFKHLAPALLARGDQVDVLHMTEREPFPGVTLHRSTTGYRTATDGHPFSRDFDTKVIRGEATYRTALAMAADGYRPDVIFAHPAWGEATFLKLVWPDVPMAVYCEYYYQLQGGDFDFDPEFPSGNGAELDRARLLLRNLPQKMLFEDVAAGISPTRFQADSYPAAIRDRISVIHDGIDTDALRYRGGRTMTASDGRTLPAGGEVITFVSRNLEPYRGYHIFMRALPEMLKRRPNAQVVLVGADAVSYGAAAPAGTTWKQVFLDEVRDRLDLSRVHFTGMMPYDAFTNLLRLSSCHVYLTYPFVASWSLCEAMAAGAPILGSATAPVEEFVTDGETGLTFDFFDPAALVEGACQILEDKALADRLSRAGRALIETRYDLKRVCLPAQLEWLDRVAAGGS